MENHSRLSGLRKCFVSVASVLLIALLLGVHGVSVPNADVLLAQSFRLATPDEVRTYSNGVSDPNQVEGLLNAVGFTNDPSRVGNASAGVSQTAATGAGGIGDFIVQIEKILNLVIPFLVGLAVFVIIYGILGYIYSAADEEKRKEARDFIMWGVLGVFAMLSVWGFVSILVNTFVLNNSSGVVTDIYKPVTSPTAAPTTLLELIDRMNAIGSRVIPFLIGIGVFILMFGLVNYIRQGDNEEKRAEGRKFIIWGVVSIFIMLSVWGFVSILVNSFQLDNKIPPLNDIFDNLKV